MASQKLQILVAAVAALGIEVAMPARAPCGVTVNSWDLGVGAGAFGATFNQVQFSFVNQHQVVDGISSAAASYNFHYFDLTFDIASTLLCRGDNVPTDSYSVGAGGQIKFTTDTDLLVNVAETYAWDLPAGDRQAECQIAVFQMSPFVILYQMGGGSAPVFGGPPIGSSSLSQTLILPAGHQYRLQYNFSLESFTGDPTVLSHGDGTAHFDMTPIPEPASLVLMAGAAVLWRRRR